MKPLLINGQNYFNEKSFLEMCKALEEGNEIEVYIDCIGHTRTILETNHYVEELQKKFGDKLVRTSKVYPQFKLERKK